MQRNTTSYKCTICRTIEPNYNRIWDHFVYDHSSVDIITIDNNMERI